MVFTKVSRNIPVGAPQRLFHFPIPIRWSQEYHLHLNEGILFSCKTIYQIVVTCHHTITAWNDLMQNIDLSQRLTYRYSISHSCSMSWWRHQMVTFTVLLAFVWGIHRWPVNFPGKGQWRGALMFSLIGASINGWVNNRDAGDLWRHAIYNSCVDCLMFNKIISKQTNRAIWELWRRYEQTDIIWTNGGLCLWRLYASLGHNE